MFYWWNVFHNDKMYFDEKQCSPISLELMQKKSYRSGIIFVVRNMTRNRVHCPLVSTSKSTNPNKALTIPVTQHLQLSIVCTSIFCCTSGDRVFSYPRALNYISVDPDSIFLVGDKWLSTSTGSYKLQHISACADIIVHSVLNIMFL